jgi:hypothetical protein
MFFCVDNVDTNNSFNDKPTSFIVQTQPIDPNERKRQRERERYAQMDSAKKEEMLQRKRDARQKGKSSTLHENNEVVVEDDEWLKRNDNYRRQPIHVPFHGQEIITSGMNALSYITNCTLLFV